MSENSGFPHGIVLLILSVALLSIVILVISDARHYYRAPVTERFRTPAHKVYKPGGRIGHPLGIGGSCLLVGLLSYSLRKRWKRLRGLGRLSIWLRYHIFMGIAGTTLITLHTSFKLHGIVAISYWSMVVVFLSGLIGRYLYAQIPRAISGQELEHQEIQKELDSINEQLAQNLPSETLARLQRASDFVLKSPGSLFGAVILMIGDDLSRWSRMGRLKKILQSCEGLEKGDQERLLRLAKERELQIRRIVLLKSTQNLFRHWHVLHLPLAQTMYITMIIHILVTVMVGYF